MIKLNPLTATDFYKTGHIFQYPEGTQMVYSNFTPRSAKHAPKGMINFDNKVVMFGLQGFMKWFLQDTWNTEFFNKPKEQVVARYKRRLDTALGPDSVDVSHIEALHDLGYLPIEIKAIEEGNRVNIGVSMLTIVNTIDEFFWVTNYLETVMSDELWKPITSATIAYEYRKIIDKWAKETGTDGFGFAPWQGHDFSMRGLSGLTDSATSGAGHLLSFAGTDTIPAIDYLEDYYNANAETELIGGSVPATEHSVMMMGGKETEIDTFRRLITEVYPAGIVSIVSDTWDFWQVITEYSKTLKEDILARKVNGLGMAKVVFRPDSGDPVEIIAGADITNLRADTIDNAKWEAQNILVNEEQNAAGHGECGNDNVEGLFRWNGDVYLAKVTIQWNRYDKQYYYVDGSEVTSFEKVELTPEQKGAVECLWDIFGGDLTEKGFKTLNQRVGLIYGDSITLARADEILRRLAAKGFSSANIVFGIGSYTYQYNTRDTFGFAMKATFGVVNGEDRVIFKDPKTDDGTKKSARGLLRVEKVDGNYVQFDNQSKEQESTGELKTVFLNGKIVKDLTLAQIRANLGTF